MEQARQKEKLIEEKHKTQCLSVDIPLKIRANGKKDDNPCRRCNAPNWRPGHKCKNNNLVLCEKSNTSDDNDEESSDTPSSDT